MPKVAEIQSQVVETVKKGQELAAETVKGWTETASKFVPQIPLPNFVPQAKSAVTTAFTIAEQSVARQREMVLGILDTVESRLSKAETKKAPAKAKAEAKTEEPAAEGS